LAQAVQVADTASELGQLFIWLKEVGSAPAKANEEEVSGPWPWQVSEEI
jgi:hypothetical protein